MQQRGNYVPQEARTASWSLFARRFAPLFSCSFLGLAAIRVWLQCCVYDLYAATDSGMATVAVNLTRGVVTLVLMAIFSRRVFSPQLQNRLGVASCILMTCGCVLLLAASETMTPLLGWVACVLSALGVVWGGGMWMTFYERFNPEESLFYAFSALSLSCLAGLVLGFLPRPLTMLVAMCIIVLLAGSMFLLISNSTPLTRPLFADIDRSGTSSGFSQKQGASQDDAHASAVLNAGTTSAPGTTSSAPCAAASSGMPTTANTSPAGPAAASAADDIETRLLLMGRHYDLTRREIDIARLLIRDLSKVQIGEVLCLSESTVRTHARNLYAKLDVHSREQLKELVEAFHL